MPVSLINYLTTIRFGEGAVAGIADDLGELDISRALVVTDRGVTEAGLVERVLADVPADRIAAVFDETPSNPTEDAAMAALTLYRDAGADGIIAVGGGSPIDLAKAIALLATHDGPLERYAAILGGVERITADVAPVLAVPTTAGTGSEVGRAALVTLSDGRKLGFISPHLIPRRAVCDPELTYGLPPALTAATGIDAISHCIETYLSPRDNPPAEAIALDGLRRAVQHIQAAVDDGRQPAARREMMMAALQGGLTFQKGLGAVHAISHPAGGIDGVALHHGMLNAVLLPHVLRFNATAAEYKYAALRHACGLTEDDDVADFFDRLVAALGLPPSLSVLGLPADAIPTVVDGALKDHSAATNPRPISREDVEKLVNAAY
ncbi:iron-containing alcohol dehydrogenase [Phytoactinopolyspora halotolerans]|uniref:Iron-containing alcohol dehydrogenase n=1 Tax=Phytoactinopolyspora halotolerans TaxID=1981512 RepID=A0A6L9S5S3_9ACTN|nr:iron-containing alcohol dehydrogenase [Phytoactinopolyspora halotolerans]NEE00397.1 iron-containing alcohol dehydrogenase [Phytoactinopolyspora halotolerans]